MFSFRPTLHRAKLLPTLLVCLGVLAGLVLAESFLRFQKHRIRSSEYQDPGLLAYDSLLGWKLTPGWKGVHKHLDFQVSYTVNPYGFRGDFSREPGGGGRRIAVVGDSFTFGFGVEDDETFVHLLNERSPTGHLFLNFGIPGYSTDQEYLLIRERLPRFSPDVILLVVYPGNDLFDNELPYPLQGNRPKPFFETTPGGLVLKNIPVPLAEKPPGQRRVDLKTVVLGESSRPDGRLERFLSRFELYARLQMALQTISHRPVAFGNRFDSALDLFEAIVNETRVLCERKGVDLRLVLLPGASFLTRPGSPSAQYQEYLREKIMERQETMGAPITDLASALARRYPSDIGPWYHPHEGHLTPLGHEVVAEVLAEVFSDKFPFSKNATGESWKFPVLATTVKGIAGRLPRLPANCTKGLPLSHVSPR